MARINELNEFDVAIGQWSYLLICALKKSKKKSAKSDKHWNSPALFRCWFFFHSIPLAHGHRSLLILLACLKRTFSWLHSFFPLPLPFIFNSFFSVNWCSPIYLINIPNGIERKCFFRPIIIIINGIIVVDDCIGGGGSGADYVMGAIAQMASNISNKFQYKTL